MIQSGSASPQSSSQSNDVQYLREPPAWLTLGLLTLRDAIAYFARGFVPDPNGQEKPNGFEWPIDQFVLGIEQSRFGAGVQGVMNLKSLGGSYLYSEAQMGLMGQVELVRMDPQDPEYSHWLAVRLTPAHLEIAWVRLAAGAWSPQAPQAADLPFQTFFGMSAGAEGRVKLGDGLALGARAYARPLWELTTAGGDRDTGPDSAGHLMVYLKAKLTPQNSPMQVSLMPAVSYFQRNTGLRANDPLTPSALGPDAPIGPVENSRLPAQLSPVIQGTLWINFKFD